MAAAISISRARFGGSATRGSGPPQWVILSRADAFPDSLAGTALARYGSLLFTYSDRLTPATREEIQRILPFGGRVYLLGGTGAIGEAVEAELAADGYSTVRLAGASRVETALAVADEVVAQFGVSRVLLARASGAPGNETSGWADSVTGGALAASTPTPVLLTPTDALHPAVDAWIEAHAVGSTILLGGTAALSPAVEAAVPNPQRVAGAERTATAAAIATDLWMVRPPDVPRSYTVIDGRDPLGWMFGLAAAGLAADFRAPMLMVTDQVTDATAAQVATCGEPSIETVVIGGSGTVADEIVAELDALDGGTC